MRGSGMLLLGSAAGRPKPRELGDAVPHVLGFRAPLFVSLLLLPAAYTRSKPGAARPQPPARLSIRVCSRPRLSFVHDIVDQDPFIWPRCGLTSHRSTCSSTSPRHRRCTARCPRPHCACEVARPRPLSCLAAERGAIVSWDRTQSGHSYSQRWMWTIRRAPCQMSALGITGARAVGLSGRVLLPMLLRGCPRRLPSAVPHPLSGGGTASAYVRPVPRERRARPQTARTGSGTYAPGLRLRVTHSFQRWLVFSDLHAPYVLIDSFPNYPDFLDI
ncbi:hypothetical protein AURDEDRAFT_116481 [Auricularia subglabra TFB-10046 SS5]|nr:hypothetical protein AURDEDRAFT_116481 [Auricularia subglabra TFB-10046 SS5]